MLHCCIFRNLKGKDYEVFFPGEFTIDQPWGNGDYRSQLPEKHRVLDQHPLTYRIKTASYVTHYEEAEEIIKSNFKFLAKPIKGKKSRSYLCVTEQQTRKYQPLDESSDIIGSGSFSWWSLDPDKFDDQPLPIMNGEKYRVTTTPSDIFQNKSSLGTVKISVGFGQLIYSYVEAIAQGRPEDIFYKMAGTFRYPHETCYVIAACVGLYGEDPLPDLPNLPNCYMPPAICVNIMQPFQEIDGKGIKKIQTSWDHYVLALYFPANQFTTTFSLLNPKSAIISGINHCHFDEQGVFKKTLNGACELNESQPDDYPKCPDETKFRHDAIPLESLMELPRN